MEKKIILFIVLIFGIFLVDIQTIVLLTTVYAIGYGIIYFVSRKQHSSELKVYDMLFIVGGVYMLLCYLYMETNGFTYLFSPDIYGTFMPKTEDYLRLNNYTSILSEIWQDYNFFSRDYFGFYTYSIPFAIFSSKIGANLYVSMQISVLLLYSLSGVVIFKLLNVNGFDVKKSYKYTIIISVFSVIFFYSSQYLRDIHIMLLSLMGIYFTFKKEFSTINLLKIIAVILITCTFRIETGLFLFVLIPVYLLLTLQRSRQKTLVFIFSLIIFSIGISLFSSNFPAMKATYKANNEAYIKDISASEGVIGTLQKIPIAGDVASIIYNALLPIPFWSQFTPPPKQPYGYEAYNFMRFPESIASIFNLFILLSIAFWFITKGLKQKIKKQLSKPLVYQLIIGFTYLYLQSAVTSTRRLMAYYVVFYIFAFIIFENMSIGLKRDLYLISFVSFILLQIIGIIYLY